MPFPFEVEFDEVRSDLDAHVDAVNRQLLGLPSIDALAYSESIFGCGLRHL